MSLNGQSVPCEAEVARGDRPLTEDDVQDLIETLREAQKQWVNGKLSTMYDLTEGTLFGPFGGPAAGGPDLRDAQAAFAARFDHGTSEPEIVQTIVAGDVVCLVAIEWNTMRFDDDSEPRPWILRTTQVFDESPRVGRCFIDTLTR